MALSILKVGFEEFVHEVGKLLSNPPAPIVAHLLDELLITHLRLKGTKPMRKNYLSHELEASLAALQVLLEGREILHRWDHHLVDEFNVKLDKQNIQDLHPLVHELTKLSKD